MSASQEVLQLAQVKGAIRARDVIALGRSRSVLLSLEKQGKLERIAPGLYALPNRNGSRYSSLIEASVQEVKGVITLLSALSLHQLTTQSPSEVWLAIPNKHRPPKIIYPRVRFVYYSGDAYEEGLMNYQLDGVNVKAYNPAKTITDCFKYRNKIGIDVALEALKEAWQKRVVSMDELWYYAKINRVHNVMRPYLESIV